MRIPHSSLVLAAITAATGIATAAPRPDIILIMSDDMGYSDLGCYGGEINTPHLDKLAANGLRYTQFYNTGRCVPTRGSLLTGLYPHQSGLGEMTADLGQPGYTGDLGRNAVTIAEVLKTSGYRTYMAGKWHVSRNLDHDGDLSSWPMQRGFDRFYGTIIGAGSFYDPWTLTRGNTAISPDDDPEYQPDTFYYTHAITDHAVRYIDEHAAAHADEPLFLYISHTAPHWPMHALEEDIEKYHGKYDAGYEAIREARFKRMRELGVIGDVELSPVPQSWDDIPEERKAWEARCMEVYAAMIDSMDQGIGKIIDTLKRHDRFDNALIIYLQDNGASHENFGREPRKDAAEGIEPMAPGELQTSIFPHRTRDGHPILMGPDVMPGPPESYISYGRNWANVSNTPLRLYKINNHEGGIATPLIGHWPKGITTKNQILHQPGHLIDLMPTFAEVAGATYPAKFEGHEILPMEGRSMVPGFAGDDPDEERILIWEHMGNAAIRRGDWKLVRLRRTKAETDLKWKLYDTAKDRSEMHDLAAEHPELAKELADLWEKHARRTLVYPRPESRSDW